MDRRFDARLREMLAQVEVTPELIDGFFSRLETFIQPFSASLGEPGSLLPHSWVAGDDEMGPPASFRQDL